MSGLIINFVVFGS